jgi:hypothetical protein
MLRPVADNFTKRYESSKTLLFANDISTSAFIDCAPSEISEKVIKDFNLDPIAKFSHESCFIYLKKN